jgi:hypothetical protein
MSTRKTKAAERGGPLVRRCLQALFSAALDRAEVEDAGLQLDYQWWNRRQNRSIHRFIIRRNARIRIPARRESAASLRFRCAMPLRGVRSTAARTRVSAKVARAFR